MKPRSRGVLAPKTLLPFRFVVPGLQRWHSHLLCMSNWVSSGPQPSATSRCLWKEQEWTLQGVPFTSDVPHQPKQMPLIRRSKLWFAMHCPRSEFGAWRCPLYALAGGASGHSGTFCLEDVLLAWEVPQHTSSVPFYWQALTLEKHK